MIVECQRHKVGSSENRDGVYGSIKMKISDIKLNTSYPEKGQVRSVSPFAVLVRSTQEEDYHVDKFVDCSLLSIAVTHIVTAFMEDVNGYGLHVIISRSSSGIVL